VLYPGVVRRSFELAEARGWRDSGGFVPEEASPGLAAANPKGFLRTQKRRACRGLDTQGVRTGPSSRLNRGGFTVPGLESLKRRAFDVFDANLEFLAVLRVNDKAKPSLTVIFIAVPVLLADVLLLMPYQLISFLMKATAQGGCGAPRWAAMGCFFPTRKSRRPP